MCKRLEQHSCTEINRTGEILLPYFRSTLYWDDLFGSIAASSSSSSSSAVPFSLPVVGFVYILNFAKTNEPSLLSHRIMRDCSFEGLHIAKKERKSWRGRGMGLGKGGDGVGRLARRFRG